MERLGRWGPLVLLALAACAGVPRAPLDPRREPLEFLGEVRVATGLRVAGEEVGGLSALVYDPTTNHFLALSDDAAERGPARLFTLEIDLSGGALYPEGLHWLDVTRLRDDDGQTFRPKTLDPEGLALDPTGGFWVSSEGQVRDGIPPFLRRFDRAGGPLGAIALPVEMLPGAGRGIRHNRGGEGLAVTPDGRFLFLALEGPLLQDGPDPTPTSGGLARLYRFALPRGEPAGAFLVPLEPVHAAARPAGELEVSGISGLLALDADTLLILERSFVRGVGHAVRLARLDLRGASDVAHLASLEALGDRERAALEPARRTPVRDLGTLGVKLDNLEGLAFGPRLPDGRRTLVLVSDNNFSDDQVTQFLAFAVGRRTRR